MRYVSMPLLRSRWSLEIDLCRDMEKWAAQAMQKLGITPSGRKNSIYEYFNLQKRLVSRRPRKVVRAAEFQCPAGYERALAEFEERVRRGGNLVPFLSDRIRQADSTDDLLNDWNIYHFHLTRQFRKDGFAKRSDYELFAWITENTMYFIQVYPHNKPYLYATQELVRIVYSNWPQLLEPYHLKDVVSLAEDMDDEQYSMVREAHATTFVQVEENQVYGLIGGGYMSDGSSGDALRSADHWHNCMKHYEIILRENMSVILTTMEKAKDGPVITDLDVILWYFESTDDITLYEKNNQLGIQMLLEEGRIRVFKPMDDAIYRLDTLSD